MALDIEITVPEPVNGRDMLGRPDTADIVSMASCDLNGNTYFRMGSPDDKATLHKLLDTELVFHNAKFDLSFILDRALNEHETWSLNDIISAVEFHDTMGMSKLLNPGFRDHSLKSLSMRLLGNDKMKGSLFADGEDFYHGWEKDVNLDDLQLYNVRDAEATIGVFKALQTDMAKQPRIEKLYRLELEVTKCLIIMEAYGHAIDIKRLPTVIEEYKHNLDEAHRNLVKSVGLIPMKRKRSMYTQDGKFYRTLSEGNLPQGSQKVDAEITLNEVFNPNSVDHVVAALRRAGGRIWRKTKGGKLSADADTLEANRKIPWVSELLHYRTLIKVYGTYLLSIRDYQRDGIIRCSFNQFGTKTGRLSASKPNLQNIPRHSDDAAEYDIVKSLFICRPDHYLLYADYAAQEMRLQAAFSGDELLRKFVENPDEDIHTYFANMTGIERTKAKSMVYAISYGAKARKLSEMTGLSKKQCEKFYNTFWKQLHVLWEYKEKLTRQHEHDGFITTYYGRKRCCESDKNALSTRVQGTGGDILKIAMVRLRPLLYDKFRDKVNMVLNIHDEIVFEVHNTVQMNDVISIIKTPMLDFPFDPELKISISVSRTNWAEKEEVYKEIGIDD